MSKKIPVVCEECSALWFVKRWEEYCKCPRCGYVTDLFNDGYADKRFEDEQ